MIGSVLSFLGLVAKPVAGIFTKREERKQAKESAQGKLALAKQNGEQEVTLTDAEWESLNAASLSNSWKDEWVTIVFTLPIPMILAGAVYAAFSGDVRLLDGTIEGVYALQKLGIDFEFTVKAVVLAAIGLKMWRSK